MAYLISRSLRTNFMGTMWYSAFCFKVALYIGVIFFSYFVAFTNKAPWSLSSSFMVQPIVELTGKYIVFRGNDNSQIITNYDEFAPYNRDKGIVQISTEKLDINNDTVSDVFSIAIDFYEDPATITEMTFVLPIELYVDGQMRFLMQEYILFSIDQTSFSKMTIIGDLTIKQKRLINQNFPISYAYNQTLIEKFTTETMSLTNVIQDKAKRDEYVDFEYQTYLDEPIGTATSARIDVLIRVKPHQQIRYYPSGFITLRDSLRPLLAILIPLYLLAQKLVRFALSNGIFFSRRQEDKVMIKLEQKYR